MKYRKKKKENKFALLAVARVGVAKRWRLWEVLGGRITGTLFKWESLEDSWSGSFCCFDASSVAVGCVGTLLSAESVHSVDSTRPGRWKEPTPSSALIISAAPCKRASWWQRGKESNPRVWVVQAHLRVGGGSFRRSFCRTSRSSTDFPHRSQLKKQNFGIITQNVVTGQISSKYRA